MKNNFRYPRIKYTVISIHYLDFAQCSLSDSTDQELFLLATRCRTTLALTPHNQRRFHHKLSLRWRLEGPGLKLKKSKCEIVFNFKSLWPKDSLWHDWSLLSLVQVVACHLAPLLSKQISLIRGSRIKWKSLSCLQFRTYCYQILCHVGGLVPPTWHKIW